MKTLLSYLRPYARRTHEQLLARRGLCAALYGAEFA